MDNPLPDLFFNPTSAQYSALIHCFDYFNRKLFGGILPGCVFSFSRKRNTDSYTIPIRWKRANESQATVHEICLTPNLLNRSLIDLLSGLVHEMVHVWQWEYGTPTRNGYHNKEWSNKLSSLGLMPSSTGEVGGKMTGQVMSQYVISGGLYERCFSQLPKECSVPLSNRFNANKIQHGRDKFYADSKNKAKYRCLNCNINIWGRPNLKVICGNCQTLYESV